MEDLKILEEIRDDFVNKFDNDPQIKRICNVMINEFKARKKALTIPVSSLTLPTEDDMFFELNKLLDSDFEANEKLAKREFGLGFKRSYRWLKSKVK